MKKAMAGLAYAISVATYQPAIQKRDLEGGP